MNRLALASLRHRLAAFVATFLAVMVGAALIVACGGLFESGLRSAAVPQRLAGADLVVTGPQGFKLPDQESETVPYAERPGVPFLYCPRFAGSPGSTTRGRTCPSPRWSPVPRPAPSFPDTAGRRPG